MRSIILFIYRLDLNVLAWCAVFAALIYCTAFRKFEGRSWLRPFALLALAAWFAVVIWTTLLSRVAGTYDARWIPLYTYYETICKGNREAFRSAIMNLALFFPAGLLWGSLMHQKSRLRGGIALAVLVFGSLSLSIELCQFWSRLGICEIDDILHNTLGGAAGAAAFRRFRNEIGK